MLNRISTSQLLHKNWVKFQLSNEMNELHELAMTMHLSLKQDTIESDLVRIPFTRVNTEERRSKSKKVQYIYDLLSSSSFQQIHFISFPNGTK